MEDYKPAQLIHIVDDIDARAIEKGYYEDLRNDDKQCFIGINNTNELKEHYCLSPMINETYVYDVLSHRYLLLDDSVETRFSESKMETYTNIFHYMGATHIRGKIVELNKKERQFDIKVGIVSSKGEMDFALKSQKKEELSKSIFIERIFGEKNTKSYEEIKKYIIARNFDKDIKLMSRLEELKNSQSQQLKGTYSSSIQITSNLDSILDIGFKASLTPFFKGNTSFKQRCSSQTEIHFELFVSFE